MNKDSLYLSFMNVALTCLICISVLISPSESINGEIVYTCGFFIVIYIIWVEAYDISTVLLKSQFDYQQVSTVWYKYKTLERIVLYLVKVKIRLIQHLLILFVLVASFLKNFNLLQIEIFEYKTSIQLLNKIKLKIKVLPLQ
jgi:hypothetical protein